MYMDNFENHSVQCDMDRSHGYVLTHKDCDLENESEEVFTDEDLEDELDEIDEDEFDAMLEEGYIDPNDPLIDEPDDNTNSEGVML
jgi:hypothetical protein